MYSLGTKKQYAMESPIMKVTTQKQMYYPAYTKETEELLEVAPKYEYVPTYKKAEYGEDYYDRRDYEYEREKNYRYALANS
jgi:hypothetical protein